MSKTHLVAFKAGQGISEINLPALTASAWNEANLQIFPLFKLEINKFRQILANVSETV